MRKAAQGLETLEDFPKYPVNLAIEN